MKTRTYETMKETSQRRYMMTVWILAAIVGLMTSGCATTGPERGSLDYQRHQVKSCKMLCAAGDVSIADIEGLECACNKQQNSTPVINNIIAYPGQQSTSAVQPIIIDRQPAVINQSTTPAPVITKGVITTDATGKQIISGVRE